MALFKINGTVVKKVQPRELSRESVLQKLFEDNLEEILDITFMAHEFPTSFGGRMDTLGIDKTGAPCIIEYKKSRNDNVINQGLSYLRWLLDHKGDFEILWAERGGETPVDWDSTRVICVAESYNKFDLDTVDLLQMNIELLKYRLYEDNLLYVEQESWQKVKLPTSTISKKAAARKKHETLQQQYSVEDHLAGKPANIVEIFQTLREGILVLDKDIIEVAKAKYIAYKTSTNFADVTIKQNSINVFLNVKSGKLSDPLRLARDLTKPKPIGHWGNGDYEIKITKIDNVPSILKLIQQSYELSK